jgi:hypothetical protein
MCSSSNFLSFNVFIALPYIAAVFSTAHPLQLLAGTEERPGIQGKEKVERRIR